MTQNILSTLTLPRQKSLASVATFFTLADYYTNFTQHFLFHLSNLQYITLLLRLQIIPLWNKDIETLSIYLQKLSDLLGFVDLVDRSFEDWTYSFLLLVVWIYFGLLTISFTIYVIKAFQTPQTEIPNHRKMFHTLFMVHYMVLFCLSNMVLMAPWQTQNEYNTTYLGLTSNLLSKINLPFVMLNCLIGGISSWLCFNPFKGEYSSRSSSFQRLTFFWKVLITLLLPFLSKDSIEIQIILAIVNFIFSLFRLWRLYRTMPYTHIAAMKASLIWTSIEASLSFINLFSLVFAKNVLEGNIATITYLNLLLIPLAIKLALTNLDYSLKSYMAAKDSDLASEEDAFRKLSSFRVVAENLRWALYNGSDFNVYEAIFLGNIVEHSKACPEETCFCKLLFKGGSLEQFKNIRDVRESLEKFFKKRIVDFLLKAIGNLKHNDQLRLVLVNLILDGENENLTLALTNLLSISDTKSDFLVRVKKEILIQKIQKRLDKHFVYQNRDVLNMKTFLDFHTHKADFIEMLLSNTRRYLDFWVCYKQASFQLLDVLKKGVSIEDEADKIDSLWNSYTKKYIEFYHQMKDIYCIYLEIIRNASWQAKKIAESVVIEKTTQLAKSQTDCQITKENLFFSDTLVFSATILKGKVGIIDYVSENSQNLLGYTQDELIGKNINLLMSPLFGSNHDVILSNHIQHGKLPGGEKGYKSVSAHIKLKQGFLRPCSLYLTIFPYIQNDINYLAIIRVYNQEDDFMIITEDGIIDGYSKDLNRTLNFSQGGFTYITDICLNIVPVRKNASSIISPRKISKLTLEYMDEVGSGGSREKLRAAVRNKFFLSNVEDSIAYQENGEVIWKELTFIKQKACSTYSENPHMTSDVRVEIRKITGNRFFLITFQQKVGQRQDQPKASQSKRGSIFRENASEIANELTLIDEKVMCSPHFLSNPKLDQKLITENICFTKMDLLSPTTNAPINVLWSDGIISPKRIQTEVSQINFETEQNLLKRRRNTQFNIITEENMKTEGLPTLSPVKIERHFPLQNTRRMSGIEIESQKKIGKKLFGASTGSMSTRRANGLEEAMYSIPEGELIKYRSVPLRIFSFSCIVLLIFLIFFANHELELIKGNFKILKTSCRRIYRLIETKRAAEGIYMLKKGLYSENRFDSYHLPPFSTILKVSMTAAKNHLNQMNGELRLSLNETDMSLHREFYNRMFPMTINDSGNKVLERNTFDAATELISRADYIIATFPRTIDIEEDENLNFIRRNTLNEFLMTSEQLTDIIVQDIYLKFEKLSNVTLCIMIVTFIFSLVLVAIFLFKQFNIVKERNKFIDLFLRLNENQITHVVRQVKRFENVLVHFNKNLHSIRYEDYEFYLDKNLQSKAESNQGLKIRRKKAGMKGINNKQAITLFLRIFLFILFIVPFVHLFALVTIKEKDIKSKLSTILEVNTEMYETILMTVSFYDYVINNGTTLLRGRPIGKEWEAIYNRSSIMRTLFLDLLISNQFEELCDPTLMKTIDDITNGDLCEILPIQNFQEICPIIANGLLRKGIKGVNGFFLFTLRDIKDEFDHSNKTLEDAKKVMNRQELEDVEIFLVRWQYMAYEVAGNLIESCTLELIDQTKKTLKIVFGLYIIACILGMILLGFIIKKLVEKERFAWRTMFRKIPIQVVSSSKLLKTYLVKESGSVLKSSLNL